MKIRNLTSLFLAVCALIGLARCGDDSSEPTPESTPYAPTTVPLGNVNVSCDQAPGQQARQQVTYQQQQQSYHGKACTPQFEFFESRVSDFDVNLNCNRRQVQVTGVGIDQSTTSLPIQSNGSWSGDVSFDQKVQNDGHGNLFCRIRTIVHFDGTASCGNQGSVDFTSQVQFAPSEAGSTSELMTPIDAPLPDVSSSPDLEPIVLPSAEPSVSPSASASSCSFPVPQGTPSSQLTIDIPQGAAALGCNAFGSGSYLILPGTTVTWINQDSAPHTVTSDSGDFDSGTIPPGESYTHTFESAGSFTYHSELDPGMQGSIVAQGQAVAPIASATPSSSPSFSPSPSPSSSASPSPSPTVTRIVECVIVRPCPIITRTHQQCPTPEQQLR